MNLYTDQMFVQTEIDRRYELAGVDRHDTHNHDRHRYDLPARPLGAHPLAAFVARLAGRLRDAVPEALAAQHAGGRRSPAPPVTTLVSPRVP